MPTEPLSANPVRPTGAPHVPVVAEQLQALIDNTSAVIYMRDLDGRYIVVNHEYERLFGLRREEVIGLTDHDLFSAEIADEFRANDLLAISGAGPVNVEETAPAADGEHTYITVKFPLLDSVGKAYAVCGISTDITARKHAEEQVRHLNAELERRVKELEASTRELDAFSYSVSHDLRAPLRSLHGFSDILLEDYDDKLDDQGRQCLQRIQSNVVRMGLLIDDLLRLSHVTRTGLNRQRVDIGAQAREIVEELRRAQPDRRVETVIADDLVTTGDPLLIKVALENLLANAWKFTGKREQGTICVGAVRESDEQVFFVRDNGVGFDMKYAEKLFNPFQRLHPVTEFDGTGIGLAIVHRILTRHGGRIWAESAPGKGCTFFFTLTDGPDRSNGHE